MSSHDSTLESVAEELLSDAPKMTLPDKDSALGRVLAEATMAAHLYGPNSGRDLWNTIWDIIREIVPDLDPDIEPEELARLTCHNFED